MPNQDKHEVDPFGDTAAPPAEVKPEPKVEAKAAQKKRQGLAYAGKLVDAPDMDNFSNYQPAWPGESPDDLYVPEEEIDFQDLSTLNREIMRRRSMSFRVKNKLAEARKNETATGDIYRRAYNRQILGLSGSTVEVRKAQAEVNTENLYTDFLVAQTVVKDLVNLSYTVSRDLDVLKTLSDNLRKQMSMQ